MRRAEWFVKGLPAPQGSKKAFLHRHSGKVIMTESSGRKHKDWRDVVHRESKEVPKFTGPVKVSLGLTARGSSDPLVAGLVAVAQRGVVSPAGP